MGSTLHLCPIILHTTHALANTFNSYIRSLGSTKRAFWGIRLMDWTCATFWQTYALLF
jgi:hypothetical protein